MKKIVLTFGLISGAIAAILMIASLPFSSKIGYGAALIVGYTNLVLSALLIFFGIRSYRENVSGGRLSFARGFAVGILIALISTFCYVAAWELVYFKFMPDFGDKYAAHMIERAKASGATPEKIQQATQEAEHFKQSYNNPIINIGYTILEIFPVGFAATLLSAAFLRRKPAPQPA